MVVLCSIFFPGLQGIGPVVENLEINTQLGIEFLRIDTFPLAKKWESNCSTRTQVLEETVRAACGA